MLGKIGRSGMSRRRVLRGAAALAGAAIGSGAVRGFPTLWAQNIKDITPGHQRVQREGSPKESWRDQQYRKQN